MFLDHVGATKAPKTHRFYQCQLRQLATWVEQERVRLVDFRGRDLDRYLKHRRSQSVSACTLRHDAIACRALFRYLKRTHAVDANPLVDYEMPRPPQPYRYMPTDEDVACILDATLERWRPSVNPKVRYLEAADGVFHSRRNHAIVATLVDTAARIGEVLALALPDYDPKQKQIHIRQAKGKEPRIVPISAELVDAIDDWLKHRPQVPTDLLFITEFAGAIPPGHYSRIFKGYVKYAKLSTEFTLHSLRRYSLNKLAQRNLWGAVGIAGHKDPKTTRAYLKLDAAHLRDTHEAAGVLHKVIVNKRSERQKREKCY